MANNGFSAPVNYWGSISGLTPKTSSSGTKSSLAEAPNDYGDSFALDEFGKTLSPSVTYVVTGNITTSSTLISLGDVISWTDGSNTVHKLMPTKVDINTQAGSPPTVTISGEEVESGATPKRLYPVKVNLSPRSKSQDVAGAFDSSTASLSKFTSINTSFSVDAHIQTVGGAPVVSDASHGRVEVSFEAVDATAAPLDFTFATGQTWFYSAAITDDNPDADYRKKSGTGYHVLSGSEYVAPTTLQSAAPPSAGDGDGTGEGGDSER